VREGAATC